MRRFTMIELRLLLQKYPFVDLEPCAYYNNNLGMLFVYWDDMPSFEQYLGPNLCGVFAVDSPEILIGLVIRCVRPLPNTRV